MPVVLPEERAGDVMSYGVQALASGLTAELRLQKAALLEQVRELCCAVLAIAPSVLHVQTSVASLDLGSDLVACLPLTCHKIMTWFGCSMQP
jgi:hypothetical protein